MKGIIEDREIPFTPHIDLGIVQDENRKLEGFVAKAEIGYSTANWGFGSLISQILFEIWGTKKDRMPLVKQIPTRGGYDPSIAVSPLFALTRVSKAIPKICSQLKYETLDRISDVERDANSKNNSTGSREILQRAFRAELGELVDDIRMNAEL